MEKLAIPDCERFESRPKGNQGSQVKPMTWSKLYTMHCETVINGAFQAHCMDLQLFQLHELTWVEHEIITAPAQSQVFEVGRDDARYTKGWWVWATWVANG